MPMFGYIVGPQSAGSRS